MGQVLLFWKQRPDLTMPAADICRELMWGEEVNGLTDLPVREILDRLQAAFPQHRETPGQFTIQAESGDCPATWSWQHLQFESQNLSPDERQRLIDLLAEFGCLPHEQN